MEIIFYLHEVRSNLPTFLGGIQLKAFYPTKVPPIFGKKLFTVPWTTTDALGFPIEFFHSFPFQRGEFLHYLGKI